LEGEILKVKFWKLVINMNTFDISNNKKKLFFVMSESL